VTPIAKPAVMPAPAPRPNPGAAGAYAVQLGAFKSGAGAAHERWARLQRAYPSLLAGLASKVLPRNTASGRLYRLQATGLTLKHARAICSRLTAKSEACFVVAPTRS
jgi:cell division septation protein DedD